MKKYIIFGFDMETDIGSYLKTYAGVQHGTLKILDILKKYESKATFFFTGDAAQHNPDILRRIADNGHEIGCHSLKHETVGDAGFNMPGDCPILESELENRLCMNVDIVKELSGQQPTSFRAPRLWQGHGQIMVLEKLGFTVDASYSCAQHKQQTLPYHPSPDNWTEAGDLSILEIPNFAFIDTDHDYSQYFCKNNQWPLLRLLGAEFIFQHAEHVIQKQHETSDIAVLLFYLHPWEFMAMPDKYEYDEGTFLFQPELHKNCGEYTVAAFDEYITLALRNGFEFTTCSAFRDIWEANK